MEIKKSLKSLDVKISKLATELGISRPTLDTYIDYFERGIQIPNDMYQSIFEYLFSSEKMTSIEFAQKYDYVKRVMLADAKRTIGTGLRDKREKYLASKVIETLSSGAMSRELLRITTESDIFSVAVIAFQLLTLWHPFIGDEIEKGTPDDETRALEIKTDYIFKAGTSNTSSYALVPQFEDLTTPEIRHLFERTFDDGKNYPALRPTAEEFLEAFQNALDLIVECPTCGFSRIYAPGEDNSCIGCGEVFEKQTMLVIYNVFSNLERDEVINSIGNYSKYDVALENLLVDGKVPANYVETCRIVLEPNEEKSKYLYLRHFESNTERSKPYAKVTLDGTSRMVRIEVSKSVFPEACLVEKNTRTRTALNQGKEFPSERYGVIFNARKHGKGYIQIFGKFIKE